MLDPRIVVRYRPRGSLGGRIVLDPRIVVRYRPRGSLGGVWRQYYECGFWKVRVMRKHRRVLSRRSLAPLGLVASLAVLAAVAPVSPAARVALAAEAGTYAAGSLGFAVVAVRQRGEPFALVARVVRVFPAFHLAYGIGMAHGWLRAATRR